MGYLPCASWSPDASPCLLLGAINLLKCQQPRAPEGVSSLTPNRVPISALIYEPLHTPYGAGSLPWCLDQCFARGGNFLPELSVLWTRLVLGFRALTCRQTTLCSKGKVIAHIMALERACVPFFVQPSPVLCELWSQVRSLFECGFLSCQFLTLVSRRLLN